jgi:phage terminase large subunit-like protein
MVKRGVLTIVDDVEINPQVIADGVQAQKAHYNIEKIAIDSYRYTVLSRALRDVGFDANEKEVKLVRPSDIMQVVQKISSMFIGNKIIWGDDPLMRWFTNNTKLEPAPNNNFKYGKIEPKSRKTDGFMAFVNAVILEDELPEYIDFEAMNIILL